MAANGISVPTVLSVTGSPALTAGRITLAKDATVTLTPHVKDAAGSTPTYSGAFNWVSRNPAQATVASATGATMVVTAVKAGEATIECRIPSFDTDGVNDYKLGKLYAEVIITVTP